MRLFTDRKLSFLEDVYTNPRDDSPRLAYADWLERHKGTGCMRSLSAYSGKNLTSPFHPSQGE